MDITRAITTDIRPGFPPVGILEGPRTVGKTHTARKLVETGVWQYYTSLADEPTLQLANHDLPGWLESLPETTIIDEAQLLNELPLQIKRIVDEPGSTRHFLLTGSARIGRTGLGGSDPLTGRVRRWSLDPLTAGELQQQPERTRTLVEWLFSGDIVHQEPLQSPDARTLIERGGFPLIAMGERSQQERDQWVRDTTLGLLTETVLPDDRFDAATARRVLDACLRDPGAILNVTSLAQRLGVNPRTVDRYLDVLERRFLLHFLPNLATNPTRQTRARSKTHPVDTAFAVESLRRSNPTALTDPTTFGHLVESYVVNQVLPSLQFSPFPVQPFYWREAKTDREVDLLLDDGEGHRVGIEVKSASRVTLSDATGLHALDQSLPLTMAYVVYPGPHPVRLADRCWAIPLASL